MCCTISWIQSGFWKRIHYWIIILSTLASNAAKAWATLLHDLETTLIWKETKFSRLFLEFLGWTFPLLIDPSLSIPSLASPVEHLFQPWALWFRWANRPFLLWHVSLIISNDVTPLSISGSLPKGGIAIDLQEVQSWFHPHLFPFSSAPWFFWSWLYNLSHISFHWFNNERNRSSFPLLPDSIPFWPPQPHPDRNFHLRIPFQT